MSLPTTFFIGRGGAGAVEFVTSQIHDSSLGVGLMTQAQITKANFYDLSPAEEITASTYASNFYHNFQCSGQMYDLGNQPVFPIVFTFKKNNGFNGLPSRHHDTALKINALKLNDDGTTSMGTLPYTVPMSRIDSSMTGFNTSNSSSINEYCVMVYPIKYRYNTDNSTRFGVFSNGSYFDGGGNTRFFNYEGVYEVDIDTLEVTEISYRTSHTSHNTEQNNGYANPFQSSAGTNVAIYHDLLFGQGLHLVPQKNTDKVLCHFGGVRNFYNNTTWASRFTAFDTSSNSYGVQYAYDDTVDNRDHTVFMSQHDSNGVNKGFSFGWTMTSPIKIGDRAVSNISSGSSDFGLTSGLTFSSQHSWGGGVYDTDYMSATVGIANNGAQKIVQYYGGTSPFSNYAGTDSSYNNSSGVHVIGVDRCVGFYQEKLYKIPFGDFTSNNHQSAGYQSSVSALNTPENQPNLNALSDTSYKYQRGLVQTSNAASYTGGWSMAPRVGGTNQTNILSFVD